MKKYTFFMTALISASAGAQTIPPACQQVLTARQACGSAYVHLAELKDPAEAVRAKQGLNKAVTSLSGQFRSAAQKNGELAVAERCASPEGKGALVQPIASLGSKPA